MLALRRVSSNVALRTARAVLVSRRTIVVGRDHGNFNWVFLMVPQVPPPPTVHATHVAHAAHTAASACTVRTCSQRRHATTHLRPRSGQSSASASSTACEPLPFQHTVGTCLNRGASLRCRASPGLNFAIPFIESVAYKRSLKETTFPIHPQTAITRDNVHVQLDGAVYAKVEDAYRASYGIDSPTSAITTLAQSAMRKEVCSG